MLWIKALHIVFVVFWFAGLLYLPRLFVYHSTTRDERFEVMERRLYRIMTVGGVGAVGFGAWLLVGWWDALAAAHWLHAKLVLALALVGYHAACGRFVRGFAAGTNRRSHVFYRYFNEVPALLLIAIVVLVVVKPVLSVAMQSPRRRRDEVSDTLTRPPPGATMVLGGARPVESRMPSAARDRNHRGRSMERRVVQCVVLEYEAEGLPEPPYPGELGQRIYENVSVEGWKQWLERLQMIINENGLNTADPQSVELIERHMIGFLFDEGEYGGLPAGFRAPGAKK